MTGWYEIAKNDKGQFSFVLKAANSQVILRGQQYESKASAQVGIASMQANAARDDRYELATAVDGRFLFNLRAGNSQVVGTSQMYAAEGGRKTGIESVQANGPSTDVREV